MPQLTQPATSTQLVQQEIDATLLGVQYNPTADVVQMAFVPAPASGLPPNPAPGQWNTASWVTDPGPVYWSSILVGPANGGVVLAPGLYVIAVKITDNPEVPVLWGWNLLIT
jgi:hypothetical protein